VFATALTGREARRAGERRDTTLELFVGPKELAVKPRILIAGIGNIFLGDDAFGVEVVREIARRPWPDEVRIVDFGIRGYDLAFALTEDYQAIILVDAVPRGEAAGTTYLMRLSGEDLPRFESLGADAHNLNPVNVLQLAERLNGVKAAVFMIGCEPQILESPEGPLTLSPPVRAAVPLVTEMIAELVTDLLHVNRGTITGPVSV